MLFCKHQKRTFFARWPVVIFFLMDATPTLLVAETPSQVQETKLTEMHISQEQLLAWVVETTISAYSYNYANYQAALQNIKQNFTANGYSELQKTLTSSRHLEMLAEKKFSSSATAQGAPIIFTAGVFNERFTWRIILPIQVTYTNADESIAKNMVATMLIIRVPEAESASGVGIESFTVREGRLL